MIPLRGASFSDDLDDKVDKQPLDSVPMAKEMLECLVWDASALAAMTKHVSTKMCKHLESKPIGALWILWKMVMMPWLQFLDVSEGSYQ